MIGAKLRSRSPGVVVVQRRLPLDDLDLGAILYTSTMGRKTFWITYGVFSLGADLVVPLIWWIVMTIPILVLLRWLTYRNGWLA
jgi:hypothetical protein